jgi:Na+-transporting NADH:ubiquinone oxidoreductase subunit NqrF
MTEHQQDKIKENIPARPQKLELKLLEKKSHVSTDIVSFKFSRSEYNNNYYLNFNAGQYAVFDLGTKEDPEGPIRSFTLASSPTEENFILISTRIRDTPFKKKLDSLDVGISKGNSSARQICFTRRSFKGRSVPIWRYRRHPIQKYDKVCYR